VYICSRSTVFVYSPAGGSEKIVGTTGTLDACSERGVVLECPGKGACS
jgi:hypothetical protein